MPSLRQAPHRSPRNRLRMRRRMDLLQARLMSLPGHTEIPIGQFSCFVRPPVAAVATEDISRQRDTMLQIGEGPTSEPRRTL